MPYLCWYCNRVREECPPLDDKETCAIVEALAAAKRDEDAVRGKTVSLLSVPGGTTKTAGQMDHTRKFNRDMHIYREAVRAGENPDQVSEVAVRKERQRQERIERNGKNAVERIAI